MLGITNLHNGMILSTLSISSHWFALGFSKRSHTNEDVFLYIPTILNNKSICFTSPLEDEILIKTQKKSDENQKCDCY